MKNRNIFFFIKQKLNKSDFFKNVLTLVSGTAIAQLIPLLIAPVLSRIYTPEEFGRLALYLSIVQILGAVANGRYELAIVLPKEKRKGVQLTMLSILITIILSLVCLIIVLIFSNAIAQILGDPKLSRWLYLVPFSVLMIGSFNALNYFNTREKTFKNIAEANIFKSFGGNGIQLLLGITKYTSGGLIIGQVFSHLFGNIKMLKTFLKNGDLILSTSKQELKNLAKRYINFPKFSLWGIFLNTAALNFLNFFVSGIYGLSTLGFFAHSYKYLGLPSSLIGNAFSQVYMESLTQALRNNRSVINVFNQTLKKLSILSFVFLVLGWFFIEDIFILYLGKEWTISGIYAQILVPVFAVRLTVSCLSSTLSVIEEQKKELYIHSLIFLSTIIVITTTIILQLDILIMIKLYSLLLVVIYLIILFFIYHLLKRANISRLNKTN